MTDRRAFITGGARFVGSLLAQRLLTAGWRVTVYDSFFHPDIVIQLAAIRFVPLCESEPAKTISVNGVETQVLPDALKNFPQAGRILASSAAVHAPGAGPHRETEPPGPVDVNGLSKFLRRRSSGVRSWPASSLLGGPLVQHLWAE